MEGALKVKDYREKEMKYLMGIYILTFLLLCTPLFNDISEISVDSANFILTALESALLSGVLSLGTFLCDSLFSSALKDKIIGFCLIPKSGETIFSRIQKGKIKDNRFLAEVAQIQYASIIANLPSECKKKYDVENAAWYKIYQTNKKDESVCQTQKDYLLCRDLCIESVFFLVLYLCAMVVFRGAIYYSGKFIVILLFMILTTNISTHTKMDRFVNTVIAIDIANAKEKE